MDKSFVYTLKIWLTTVLVAPVVFLAVNSIVNVGMLNEAVDLFFLFVIIGFCVSFIPWGIFSVAVYHILVWDITPKWHKIAIQFVAIFLALATFIYFAIDFDSLLAFYDRSFLLIIIPYVLCLAISIHLYKLPNLIYHQQENSTT